MAEPQIILAPQSGVTVKTLYPILSVEGEAGLEAFCSIVRGQWAADRDFVIDFTAFVPGVEKASIEFRRGA